MAPTDSSTAAVSARERPQRPTGPSANALRATFPIFRKLIEQECSAALRQGCSAFARADIRFGTRLASILTRPGRRPNMIEVSDSDSVCGRSYDEQDCARLVG